MRPRYPSTVRRDVVNNITDLTENGDERSGEESFALRDSSIGADSTPIVRISMETRNEKERS
jgi:hypothetical protein